MPHHLGLLGALVILACLAAWALVKLAGANATAVRILPPDDEFDALLDGDRDTCQLYEPLRLPSDDGFPDPPGQPPTSALYVRPRPTRQPKGRHRR